VIDVGVQDALRQVRRTAMDFDMDEVASILDKRLITEAVIKHWKANASSRKTIVFCSTVAHAQNVCDAFVDAGVHAVLVHGELSDAIAKRAWLSTRRARRSWSTWPCSPRATTTPHQLRRPAATQLLQIHLHPDGWSWSAHCRP
jgi:hypothetical protein